MHRRGLLKGLLFGAGVSGLAAMGGGWDAMLSLAQADPSPKGLKDRYTIFCYFRGGWDILLSLDPRDPRRFRDDNRATTLIQPAYELLESGSRDLIHSAVPGMVFGPHIGNMVGWASELAVIRGMSMETLTHDAGRRRFLTGKPPSGLQARGSSTGTWLAAHLGAEQLIPQLSVQVESFNVNQPNYASALVVSSVPDLSRALSPTPSTVGQLEARQIRAMLEDAANCPEALRSDLWQRGEESRTRAVDLVERGLGELFDFGARTGAMEELRGRFGIPGTSATDLASPEAQTALAFTALTQGVSRVVSIQLTNNLDTHYDNWTTDQGPSQERGFNAIARLLDALYLTPYPDGSGDSWFDRTTVVGFSEFSRTPLLNDDLGRDHSLTNACFLAGGGIRGGVYGASSDLGMAPTRIDLATGQPDQGGEVLKPEHIQRALMVNAGIDDDIADLRVEPLQALLS